MLIQFDDRPCGSGKTYTELLHAVSERGRYLLAVDRKDSINDHNATLEGLVSRNPNDPKIVLIYSGDESASVTVRRTTRIVTSAVRQTVECQPSIYDQPDGHVIVLVTHEALKQADLTRYRGWHLIIDEVPSIVDQQTLRSHVSRDFFERNYKLETAGGWSEICSVGGASAADVRRDTLTASIAVMHARVLDPKVTVLTRLKCWDNIPGDREWQWTSIWAPKSLTAFASITVLANAFTQSLTFEVLSKMWPEITWRESCRPTLRQFHPRQMRIRYFAQAHVASRLLFNSDAGKQRLSKISEYVTSECSADGLIWTCNERDTRQFAALSGLNPRLSPRQAGSNRHAHASAAAIIYSAKPSPDERGLWEALGVDPMSAVATREFETIYQFVSRTSVRTPDCEKHIEVFVYDHQQAAYLEQMFDRTGFVETQLELVDLGFSDAPPPPKPGRPKTFRSENEQVDADEKKRAAARDRKRKQRERERDLKTA